MPTSSSIFFRSVTHFLGISVASIQNGTFSLIPYILREGITLFVRFSVSMDSNNICPLWNAFTISGDSDTAEIVTCYPSEVVAFYCVSWLDALWDSMLDIWERSLPVPNVGTVSECIGTIYLSFQKSTLMQQSMHVMPSKMYTAKFQTIQSNVRTCGSPIFTINQMSPFFLIYSFVDAQSLAASRNLVRHFQCGIRWASLLRFGPSPASTMLVVNYTADKLIPMQICILYKGFKGTYVTGTSNST